jgi:hypothetical protein
VPSACDRFFVLGFRGSLSSSALSSGATCAALRALSAATAFQLLGGLEVILGELLDRFLVRAVRSDLAQAVDLQQKPVLDRMYSPRKNSFSLDARASERFWMISSCDFGTSIAGGELVAASAALA